MAVQVLERLRRAVRGWTYPFAALVIAVAAGLYLLLEGLLGGLLFITFFPAVFAVALLAGWRVGLFALVLGLFVVWWVIIPPAFSATWKSSDLVRLLAFAVFGGLVLYLAALLESAERRSRQEAERAALLFRELRHRVGNVLQLCSSLLRLRAQHLPPAQRHVVTDAAAQLIAMQRIHDRIAGAGDTVELEPALRDLCEAVIKLAPGLRYELRCDGVRLPRDHLIPVGLIVHELVNNAIEHAYGRAGTGTLVIEASKTPQNGGWRLKVIDDGPGLPDGFSIDRSTSQGLKIVRALAEQVGASFTLQNRSDGPGARADLSHLS